MADTCPSCRRNFKRLGTHWARSECERPSFSEHQIEILVGLLMGDGDIHGRSDPNPHFRIRMTNPAFLSYLDDCFGVLSTGVFLDRDADYQYRQAAESEHEKFTVTNREEYNDLHGLRTRSHPQLHELKQWYRSGEKRFPSDLTITPTIAKMWYVCDGWLAQEKDHRPCVMIKATNEADRAEYLKNLFSEQGLEPHFTRTELQFTTNQTEGFLDWIGSPLPGFEYKWPSLRNQE
ncbi:hypothetical protein [Halorussus halophilus]|uniref:hypothetical protein n=1 Tax=Halorussus halophilus TaxID=2650975 RepID=UPI0013017C7C